MVQQRRLGPRLSVDDHNNPSIYVRPDGRLSIFYSDHSGPRMYMRTTRYPYSFRSISGADTLPTNTSGRRGYTYPNPVRASKRLWLFFRGGNWQPNYSVRLPGRWSRARTLVWGPRERRDGKLYQHRPYAKYDTDGRTIKATFTEGNEGAYRNSVYYAEVRPGDGLYTARGRRVSRLGDPPAVTRLDRVRGPSSGQWALDIAADRGRPVIVYRRGGGPREYWYARHDGERWRNYKITSFDRTRQGQVASITLDHETPNTVYLSNMGSRGRLEIEVWVTPDRGRTWIRRAITRGSRVDNFRPVSLRNLTGREEVAWFAGSRTHYRDFDTDVIVQLVRAAQRIAEGLGLANDDSGEGAAR